MDQNNIVIYAINFFVKHTSYESSDIKKIKLIHKGYTNYNFLVTLKTKKKYIIRIVYNKMINFINEQNAYYNYQHNKFIYYDDNGWYIKEYILAKKSNFFLNKKQKLINLVNEINQLHSINISKLIQKMDYKINQNLLINNNLENNFINDYYLLLEKYKNQQLVFSHNDLNDKNILYFKNKVILIDFEWSRMNYDYFDFANYIITKKINYKKIVKIAKIINYRKQDLINWIYICLVFNYNWFLENNYNTKNLNKKIIYWNKFIDKFKK